MQGCLACRVGGRLGVFLLEKAHRWRRTGRVFERLHALMRAHLYGLGLLEAGGIPVPAAKGERADSMTA